MKYLLGIDFGGGASKATLIDTCGNIVCENTVEYETLHPTAKYPDGGVSFETYTNNIMLEFETLGELKIFP